jgi:hypothetical protein
MGYTALSDALVPEIFTPYRQAITEEKSRLVQSGALVRDQEVDALLAGGGMTFNLPRWKDLDDTGANVSAGTAGSSVTPLSIGSFDEIAIRLSRNQSWGAARLVKALAGSDPMSAVAARTGAYWAREAQRTLLAIMKGVLADNAANDSGDMTNDISGSSYTPGVTDFSAEAFIDTLDTMGDSENELGIVMMHSKVFNRARKNNLIDFVPDSTNQSAVEIPYFLGRLVIVDDSMPKTGSVFETWIFGQGALVWGVGTNDVPVEVYRLPLDGNGGGTDAMIERVEWTIHPRGFAFTGTTTAGGGPTNAATSGNLGVAGSWDRVVPERKQVHIARLITREA